MNARKRTFKRVLAALLVSLMMMGFCSIFASAAGEETLEYPISDYNPGNPCYEPIPMVVIMINFDADGDGVDDNPNGTYEDSVKVKTRTIEDENDPLYGQPNPTFGEQWCHTTEEDWTSRLFSFEGNTLNTYYKYMSDDKFWWIPAEETYGEQNNGVIAVTIKNVHPNCIEGSGQWVHCFNQIVEAASDYVDFSVFDKNKNGILEKYELCLAFILGGAETSSGTTNMKEPFGFHAYYKSYDPNNVVKTDGVEVSRSGFFGTGAISGGHALNFGVFAHELGHYLGAPDLYDTSGTKYDDAVGTASLMASGAHGNKPAHIDPYLLSDFGFCAPQSVMEDGTYTLYSKASKEGKYNILKLCTPNPKEYFLIENRYSSIKDGSTFDNGVAQGILIWHIDENIHKKGGNTCNSSDTKLDPAVVVYNPLGSETAKGNALAMYSAFKADHPTYPNYAIFKAASYTYPVSKTWYTSLKPEEAELVKDLKVEVVSATGDEMQVKITGSYKLELAPSFYVNTEEATKTSLKGTVTLKTLNFSTLTSAKLVITEKSTGTVVKDENIVFKPDYTFDFICEGLKAGTTYEYKIVGESSHGAFEQVEEGYTKPEEVKKVKITLVANSDHITQTTQTVNVGSYHKIRFSDTKYGYKLEGWYLDEAFTQPYETGETGKLIEKEGDFTIYAKWVELPKPATTAPAATTTPTTAPEPTTGNNATTAGTTAATAAPANVGCGGSANMDYALIGGGAIVALIGGAAGAKSGKKKNDSEESE